jgi:hypothetical protein
MEVLIEKLIEVIRETGTPRIVKLWNPGALDHKLHHRMASIERTDEHTRIDFIYRAPDCYINGGWIQMEGTAYISPVGSGTKYSLIQAINIPIAPVKHYFKRKGEFHTYTLIFPALPAATQKIDIIEKEAPGTYFNFYGVDFSKWMSVPHPAYAGSCNN